MSNTLYPPAMEEQEAERWLNHAYGAQVADEAMKVPHEIRVKLYSDLFSYGPSMESALMLISQFELNVGSPSLNNALETILRKTIMITPYRDYQRFQDWAEQNNFSYLLRNLMAATVVESGNYTWRKAANFAAFMVATQHLLGDNDAEAFQPYVRKVNRVLRVCKMKPLGEIFERNLLGGRPGSLKRYRRNLRNFFSEGPIDVNS